MRQITTDFYAEETSPQNINNSSIEQEYIDYICNIYCPYFRQERHLLIRNYDSIVVFNKDKQIAEMEVNLIKNMGYIPKSAKLLQLPLTPKSPTDSLTVHKINRINEVMNLFNIGIAKYNSLMAQNEGADSSQTLDIN